MKHLAGLTTGALALVAAFAGSALADGIPTRAPVVVAPPPPPERCPPGRWTGFYVGGNLGWARLEGEFHDHHGFYSSRRFFDDDEEDGFTAGGQAGYNLQCGNVVLGVESDINWAGFDNDNRHFGVFPNGAVVPFHRDRSMDWFGTIRGRIGWANDHGFMVYATGGAAYTQMDRGHRGFGIDFNPDGTWGTAFHDDSDDVQWGWTAGGGVEWLWSDSISFKAEALWIDFEDGSSNRPLVFTGLDGSSWSDRKRFSHDDDMVVARVGVNFKFGHRAPPVYEPLK